MTTRSLACLLALGSFIAQNLAADQAKDLPHAFDAGWQGQQTCELLYETPELRVARCSFPPGVGHEWHYHNPHFGYVLAGGTMRLENADGETVVTSRAGDTWSTDTMTVHQGLNIGDTTTSYLVVEPRVITP